MARASILLGALLPLFLGSCKVVNVCRACLDDDPDLPVSVSPASFDPIAFDKPLPVEAANLYFDESCGIDCAEVFRFDLPSAEAQAIMTEFTGIAPAALDEQSRRVIQRQFRRYRRDWLDVDDLARASGGYSDVSVPDFRWPFHYFLVPLGPVTRVYLFDNTW